MNIFKYIIIINIIFITICNGIGSGGHLCENDMVYLSLDTIQPFGYNSKNYQLEWKDANDKFSNVEIGISGGSNPLIVGQLHQKELINSPSNSKFFKYTSYQDIHSLMHYSCGQSASTVTFNFTSLSSFNGRGIALIVFGLEISDILDITVAGLNENTTDDTEFWTTIQNGNLVHTDGKNSIDINSKSPKLPNGNLQLSESHSIPYTILECPLENQISKIEMTLSNKCQIPDCKVSTVYYSLLAIKSCDSNNSSLVTNPSKNYKKFIKKTKIINNKIQQQNIIIH
ncbi:hypothetical protein DLAC_06718 [Tieghemostelium lacteum]|uniref:Uncharacterized protein n=1 Tax=Tieghemostelium lacteum TaxID=361077 RepID=A0A151ZFS2_TIELA|nr:hypothetical protein DLAC_06718 [Tieghemostelium lacteum]|eukprot:KYQ92714.1 hypothetical protein DLAC_06718 [Tieghemostelium lacteum]